MAPELRYGMIKYNVKEDTFIIIDRNRTLIYDSRIGFLDIKALSLKEKLESDEINKLIAYIKPLMNSATDRNTINTDNYIFYSNKFLTSKGIKIQNDVLTKEKFVTNCLKYGGSIIGFVGFLLRIYYIFKPDSTVRAAAQKTTRAGHLIKRNTLASFAYGEEHDGTSSIHSHGTSSMHSHETSPIYNHWAKQEEYLDEY